jgi:hypothetical protein
MLSGSATEVSISAVTSAFQVILYSWIMGRVPGNIASHETIEMGSVPAWGEMTP